MNQRTGTRVLAIAFFVCLGSACTEEPAENEPFAREHPNLVIVLPDQMRGQALGFMNEDPVVTPNLDRLASEGVVLAQAVVNYPVCSPMRAMFMTGRYPHSNGVVGNCNSVTAPFGYELRQADRTWSDVLADKGYSLGYIGKWYLDAPHEPYVESSNNTAEMAWNEWCPPERRHGFDSWYAYGTYDQHTRPMYWAADTPRDEAFYVDQWGPEHEADRAIAYIQNEGGDFRDADQPFALVVAMNPPHMPYGLVPEKYVAYYDGKTYRDLLVRPNVDVDGDSPMSELARTQTKNYFAMVTGVDEQFGRILEALEEEGLANDTIVLFTSDHGNCLGTHGQISKNNHYEESMRVPFLVRWPGRIEPRHDDLMISTPDIFPTLLDFMGFAEDIPAEVEGASYASILLTGEGERPTSQLYLWVPPGEPAGGRRGVRTRRYTLMIEKTGDRVTETTLHDNKEDPYQLRNIADESPDVVERLIEEELTPWLEKTNDPWLTEEPL